MLDVKIEMGVESAAETLLGFDRFKDFIAIVNLPEPGASH